jgi:hypothetical protein
MKNYYIEIKITYTDNSESEPFHGDEMFEYIMQAANKKEANAEALKRARQEFDDGYNDNFDDVTVKIFDSYLTTSDARL